MGARSLGRFNPKTEVGLQKETKGTKEEGVGAFVREIFPTVPLRAERVFPSLPLLPSVNPISAFGFNVMPPLTFAGHRGFSP
jgi:hypothetical protein